MTASRDVDLDGGTETERQANERDTIEVTNGDHDNTDEQVRGVQHLSESVQKKFDTYADTTGSTRDDIGEEKGKSWMRTT